VPRVLFTAHLQKHVSGEPLDVNGATVAEALDAVFVQRPTLRSYLLDDQGRVRQHVMIFVDNQLLHDRDKLSDAVRAAGEIYVMQALSGG
jgi:molybdopterin converting factor small subunit